VTRTGGGGLWVVLGLLLALAALGGCGEEDDEPAAPRTTSTPAGTIELSIRFDDGAGRRETASLTCRGGVQSAGGYLEGGGKASAGELCAKARSLEALLTTAPDAGRVCTQIYGGPETARVTGTIDGKPVDRRFTRTNGCEIADFQRAAALLQP
jgi:hypothetical protein